MVSRNGFFGRRQGFLHRHFLWLLAGSYLLAAVCPWPGAAIRHAAVLDAGAAGVISLPVLLLAGLAFSSCGRKDCDPQPKRTCGTQAPTPPKPSGSN